MDTKFLQFLKEFEKTNGKCIKHSSYWDALEQAFVAGRAAQREEDGEHKVTNIGQHL